MDFVVVQSLSRIQLFVNPWTAAHQASLSLTISWSLPKFMSIESVITGLRGWCLQVLPAAEAPPAVRALEGLLACVAALVDREVVALAEGLPALTAHVWPPAQVRPLVLQQVLAQCKALAALPAAVRLLLLVRPLVSDQVGAPTEAFPTLRALERFPEGAVGLEVIGQRGNAVLGQERPGRVSHRAPGLLLAWSSQLWALESSLPAPLCLPASELPLGVCQLGLCLLVLAPQAYRTKEIQTNAEEDLKGNF